MKNLLDIVKLFLISNWYVWLAIIIAFINTLIWDEVIGIITLFGIVGLFNIYLWGREIYWRITKTGDYENKNKEE
ncbi:MAG: hypothetical protein ACOCP8_07185 [archaeon]